MREVSTRSVHISYGWKHSSDKGKQYQVATITEEGVKISDSRSAATEWKFAEGLRGYGAQTQ